jgi:hypothetical protein
MKKRYFFVAPCRAANQLYAQKPQPCPDAQTTGARATIGPSTVIPGAIYSWSPTSLLTDPNSPNHTVINLLPRTYTYTLSMVAPGPNLVVNGDFAQGNTGFSSQYTYIVAGDHGDPDVPYVTRI